MCKQVPRHIVPLMAMCSMAISLVNCKDHDATTGSRPLWMQLLKDKCSVHEAWMETLKQSPIAQFGSDLRLGIIVDVQSCQWLHFIPAMLDSHVPIWFYCSHPSQVQGSGKKLVSFWPTQHLLLTR